MKCRAAHLIGAALWVGALAPGCGTPQTKTEEPQLLGTPPKPSEDPFYYLARPPETAAAETRGTIGDVSTEQPTVEEPTVEVPAAKEPAVEAPTVDAPAATTQPVEASPDPALLQQLASESAARQAAEAELALATSRLEQARAEHELLQRNYSESERSLARVTSAEVEARRALLSAKQDLESTHQTLRTTEQSLITTQQALEKQREQLAAAAAKPAAPAAKPTPSAPTPPTPPTCHTCVRICPEQGACDKDAEVVCGWGSGKDRKAASQRARAECDGALESMRSSGAYSRVSGQCPVAKCQ